MTPFFAATHDDFVHPSQKVAEPQQINPNNRDKLTTPFYRMKKDSLRFQKLRFLFTWSRPRRSSLSPTTSERMSSRDGQFSNKIRLYGMGYRIHLTILEISWAGRVQGPRDNGKLDLLELLALDTGSFGKPFLGFPEDLTLLNIISTC